MRAGRPTRATARPAPGTPPSSPLVATAWAPHPAALEAARVGPVGVGEDVVDDPRQLGQPAPLLLLLPLLVHPGAVLEVES